MYDMAAVYSELMVIHIEPPAVHSYTYSFYLV